MGRGVGATMPAWMTDLGLADKLGKKSHRKVMSSVAATVSQQDGW